MKTRVLIGIPTYNYTMDLRMFSAINVCSIKGALFKFEYSRSGILPYNFNSLMCRALNARQTQGVTHFLLWHNDIAPTSKFWLDEMISLLSQYELDALSVVAPIKDKRGLTSTGLDLEGGDSFKVKRLTMYEVLNEYDQTFTAPRLAINTGLLLINLVDNEWLEKCPFTFKQRIVKKDGALIAEYLPEDWCWSRQARRLGAKLGATTRIPIVHVGQDSFSNQTAWGTWQTDKDYKE